MPLTLQWSDIAVRLALAILAGTLIGINRSERGEAAGLRTIILVCLAAAVAMIQVNLLLSLGGKAPDSFATLDLMRLPLGILTGMGFIGGGAILRRGSMVVGVTTAATLWIVTVIGLCFGGGQLVLGMTTLAITMIVLWILRRLENLIPQLRHATVSVSVKGSEPTDDEIGAMLSRAGLEIRSWDVISSKGVTTTIRKIRCELSWRAHRADILPPPIVSQIEQMPGVTGLRWNT